MDDRAAAGLLSFVTKGGRAIITGEYATKDPVGRPLQSAAVRQVEAALRLVSKPLSEWTLDGFAPEGPGTFRVARGAGLASLKFSGQPGQYLAYLNATDESDGESQFGLSVNGQPVCSGKLDYDDDQTHVFKTGAFSLKPGDVVQLTVKPDGGEPGRVHSLVLANAAAETGAPLGAGQVVYSPSGLETMPAAQLLALLQPKVRLPEPGKVCVNVMDVPGRGLQTVHLVNYDFRYDVAHPGRYASDDGTAEKRTYFGSNSTVVRKRVHIDKPDQVIEPVLQLQGSATPDTTAELVATINGKPAARIAAATMGGWVDVPVAPALLQGDNVIELRAEGAVDGVKHWFQIGIDTDTHAGNSEFSTDGGRTFTQADLSPDLQAQTGEYLIRIVDKSPGGERHTADNLARNPGFEQVTTPHGETKLTVAAAKDLKVQVQGASRTALAISPERAPLWLQGQTSGKITTYTVPEVGIYTVLVLGPSRQALQPVYQTQMAASPWSVPPVTEPLRTQVSAWDRFGAGFVTDAAVRHGGEHSIACENATASDLRGASQQFEFDATTRQTYQLSAWSRAENVSGSASGDYSIYVDATCTDGTVFNGHATPFATGTHDWQQAKLELTPPAPLKTLRLHLLFRRKTGKVWFDDVQVQARPAP